jgi:hypothetical protein
MPMTPSPELLRLWALADVITPLALRVAATLRVADQLPADGSPRPVAELAPQVGADADALSRLLRYLAAREVFSEPVPGGFALSPLADLLRDDHPAASRRWLDLEGFGGRMDLAFVDLLATVRSLGNVGGTCVHPCMSPGGAGACHHHLMRARAAPSSLSRAR